MVLPPSERERQRFGSARWASAEDIAQAGLFKNTGLPFGYFENHLLRFDSDAPRITVGGAGSGKLRDLLGLVLCLPCSMPMAVLDPRGELWDISVPTLAAQNIYAYSWDPYGVGDISHSINPLDHLTPERRTLFAEIVRLARAILPLSQSSNGKYFELTAQNVLIVLIHHEVLTYGGISFPRLYELIHIIEAEPQAWANYLESMLASPIAFIRTGASVMMIRQQDTPKEFGSVMGEIYAYTIWLNDDAIRDSLKGGEASLQEIVNASLNGGHSVRFHFKVPGHLLELCAPILRVFCDTLMLLNAMNRGSPRILLLIDEAAMLGKFNALKEAFSFGRGSGMITWAIFQDLGQIETNFGRAGIQTFLGSAAMRQFFGVRDITIANIINQMCGNETLEYNDTAQQAEAEHHMNAHINALLDGADPFETAQHMHHYRQASNRKSKMRRELIAPSEVLNMNIDEAITFLEGNNIPPIFHNKYPYYEKLKAGQFYPNPHHPPIDKIKVRTWHGSKWVPVRRVPVPPHLQHFPQHKSGYMNVIKG